jgi:hypothetical protein
VTATPDLPQAGGAQSRAPRALITDARFPTSKDQASRQKRYTITMAFRTACFVALIFVPGAARWVLFACAVFLPYIAVVLANQANTKAATGVMQPGAPSPAPQIGVGHAPEIISGSADDEQQERRSA